jgi:hypothetical protein
MSVPDAAAQVFKRGSAINGIQQFLLHFWVGGDGFRRAAGDTKFSSAVDLPSVH